MIDSPANSPEERLQMTKKAWDAYHTFYMEAHLKEFPDYYEFYSTGGVHQNFEFKLLDVRGLKLLDTCCACDASQAFSWSNLGALVTACDISPIAIDIAKKNADIMGLKVDFKVDDAQSLASIRDGEFDVVYATYLVWYEDIEKALHNWYRVLRAEGKLLMVVQNPLLDCLEEQNGSLKVVRNYHDRSYNYDVFDGTPLGKKHGFTTTNLQSVEYHHTIADMVNGILQTGFVIEQMVEDVPFKGTCDEVLAMLPNEIAFIARKP